MVTRRKFSREFKLEAVKLVTERGMTVAQAAKDLDCWRRFKSDQACRLNFDQGPAPGFLMPGCG